jgi:hypothetical protein
MEPTARNSLVPIPAQNDGAIIEGAYRYLLWRTWDASRPRALWILLNPSVADARLDDRTLGRCKAYSANWQFGGLEIVNLFAFRTPHPHDLFQEADPVGQDNDQYLAAAARRATDIVLAWGAHGSHQQRDRAVLALLEAHTTVSPYCLGVTVSNSPRHPLYVARNIQPIPFMTMQAKAEEKRRPCANCDAPRQISPPIWVMSRDSASSPSAGSSSGLFVDQQAAAHEHR